MLALPDHALIFVEDPGAANFVAGLPAALAERGLSSRLLAAGSAATYLAERGIAAERFADARLPDPASALLIVGASENLDTAGLRLVEQWRQAGGHSIGVVDAFANAAHRFRGRSDDALRYAPDWLMVPDAGTRDAYVALGYPAARIEVCGHPHYDATRQEGQRLEDIGRDWLRRRCFPGAEDQPWIVFVAEISTGLDAEQFLRSPDYTLVGRGTSRARTAIVLEELLEAVAGLEARPRLALRLHPKNTPDEFARYLPQFDLVSSGGSPLELIFAADLVVGMSSMLLLEAALLHRPALSILPRACERDWLPTTRASLTPCALTRAELQSILPRLLYPASAASLAPQLSTLNSPPQPLLQSRAPNADIDTMLPAGSTGRAADFIAHRLACPS